MPKKIFFDMTRANNKKFEFKKLLKMNEPFVIQEELGSAGVFDIILSPFANDAWDVRARSLRSKELYAFSSSSLSGVRPQVLYRILKSGLEGKYVFKMLFH